VNILNNDPLGMSTKFLTTGESSAILTGNLQHVLVIQLANTSDVVMMSPALRALRERLPDTKITFMTSSAGSQLAPLLPWVDKIIVDQSVWRDRVGNRSFNPREDVAIIERLRRENFSLALIFTDVSQSSQRAAYACYLAGIPYRVGFAGGANDSTLSHILPPPADDMHQVDRNLSLLSCIGISARDTNMELNIPEHVTKGAHDLLSQAGVKPGVPYIVIAPGRDGIVSPYDPTHFASVAHILAGQIEQQLIVIGSSSEAKTIQPVMQVAEENLYGNMYSLVEKTTLPEMAAIIQRASLTISNNSVNMYFADAFGCPMVILYSETEMVSQWRPRNALVRLLERPASCSSCNHAACFHGINCSNVRPEEVAIAALELLSEQTYSHTNYKEILGYKIETEKNEESSTF
jgi:ADP-heptose:LPS heptosyltransferase